MEISEERIKSELPLSIGSSISSEAEIIEIQIINLEGQLVKSLKGNKKTVSLQGLSKGIYFVKCETEAGTSVKKFIKQ